MKESSSFDLQKDSKKKFYIEGEDNPFTQFSSGTYWIVIGIFLFPQMRTFCLTGCLNFTVTLHHDGDSDTEVDE